MELCILLEVNKDQSDFFEYIKNNTTFVDFKIISTRRQISLVEAMMMDGHTIICQ
jgi:hypothetical protein